MKNFQSGGNFKEGGELCEMITFEFYQKFWNNFRSSVKGSKLSPNIDADGSLYLYLSVPTQRLTFFN